MSLNPNTTTSYSSVVAGNDVEGRVIDLVDELDPVVESETLWYDAIVRELIVPSDRLPFSSICVVVDGTEVEIKSCQYEIANGGGSTTSGRFYLRADQHGRLVDAGAVYIFAVYAPNPPRRVLGMVLVPASIVDEIVRDKWHQAGADRCESAVAKISWSTLPIDVPDRRSVA